MSCGSGHRCGLDPMLLWLWHRQVATALIRPLALESPYVVGAALEKAKRPKKKWLSVSGDCTTALMYTMCNFCDVNMLWVIISYQCGVTGFGVRKECT